MLEPLEGDTAVTPVADVQRTPVPGPPPTPGAQWDEVHARWECWDDRSGRWVVVAVSAETSVLPADEMTRRPAILDPILEAAPEATRVQDDWVIDLRSVPERPDDVPGAQWNEVDCRWERWDERSQHWERVPIATER